jgi:hypothetical protein
MTNPTTNFGWQMPTPTDLVTDLPADFEVFGQAVDTDFVDLLGGTTGQILSKTSNTDLDFTWITNDVGDITAVNVTSPITGGGSSGAVTIGINAATTSVVGAVQLSDSTSTTSSVLASTPTATKSAYDLANAAIAKSTVTTAGDIIYRNATVPTRLGIGTAGQVLQVNSGATAPEWGTASSGALTKIVTGTFSNVTNTGTTFDGCFTSTYDNYVILFSNMYASAGSSLRFQTRLAGSTQATANYAGSYVRGSTVTQTSSATSYNLMSMQNVSTQQGVIDMTFFRNTTKISWTYVAAGRGSGDVNYNGAGFNDNVNANGSDGFIISADTANIYGTITVYGVAK